MKTHLFLVGLKIWFAFQVLSLVQVLWQQCNIDIFFIDWERPRVYDHHIAMRNNIETPSISSGVRVIGFSKKICVNSKLSF